MHKGQVYYIVCSKIYYYILLYKKYLKMLNKIEFYVRVRATKSYIVFNLFHLQTITQPMSIM